MPAISVTLGSREPESGAVGTADDAPNRLGARHESGEQLVDVVAPPEAWGPAFLLDPQPARPGKALDGPVDTLPRAAEVIGHLLLRRMALGLIEGVGGDGLVDGRVVPAEPGVSDCLVYGLVADGRPGQRPRDGVRERVRGRSGGAHRPLAAHERFLGASEAERAGWAARHAEARQEGVQ